MKLCCKCKTTKPYTDFYGNKTVKDGLNTFCKECHKADNIARKKLNRQDIEFKAKETKYKREYRIRSVEQRKEYMKQWHKNNLEQQRMYREQYRKDNNDYFKLYAKENKHKINSNTRKRQCALIQRIPKWLTDDDYWMIEQAYELAALRTRMLGFNWHVDHILPLQGKIISGLHVPVNLQVITARQNYIKSNKLEAH